MNRYYRTIARAESTDKQKYNKNRLNNVTIINKHTMIQTSKNKLKIESDV